MKKSLFRILFLATFVLALFSCAKNSVIDSDDESDADEDNVRTTAVHEASSDYTYDASTAIAIAFNGTTITTASSNVTVSGSTATITAGGTYIVTGTLTNGQLLVNAKDQVVKVILNGVTMSNSATSPFYVKKSEKTILILADNTTNTISDASSYSNTDDPNAAICSNSDLTIFGNGSLTVKGNYNDGISSDDGLIIKSGTINVSAKDDAIRGKDYLIVEGGNITTTGAGQALKSDYDADTKWGYIRIDTCTMVLTSTAADGIHSKNYITINGGTISISAAASQGIKGTNSVTFNGGSLTISQSTEGVESATITVNGGNVYVNSSDDGFNGSKGNGGENNDGSLINLKGGNVYINATGGDGLDSNGSISMTGGTVIVNGPKSQPEVGLDYNGTFNITGGILAISGVYSNMSQSVSSSSAQSAVLLRFSSSKSAGNIIHIQDSNGNELISFAPLRAYSYLVFSSPSLAKGATYSVYSGGSSSVSSTYGYYKNGTYTTGTKLGTFTTSSGSTLNTATL